MGYEPIKLPLLYLAILKELKGGPGGNPVRVNLETSIRS